jgi:hypothetical protein
MWWTVLAVGIAVLAVVFLLVGSQIFRYGGRSGQSVADVNARRFWWLWGRRPGD